jgi:glycosyltransferase involved in cell wall biosynthesis
MPLAEARSCGTPVVSTDLPEMREAAENDGTFITLQALERDLPPLFLKQHIHHPPAPATYPSPQHLAQQMATVLF